MRIFLTEPAVRALEELQTKLKSHNQNIEPSGGLFLNQLLSALNSWLSSRDIKGLASQLTSARIKRRLLREFLSTIADKIGDDALESVEKTAQNLKHFVAQNAENTAISAEKEQ